MSFAGLTFLALWVAGRFRLFVPHSPHGKHIYAYIIPAIPLLLAAFIATSRVSDYRHRGTDVLAGTLLGIFFGILGYTYYFPWLDSPLAGTPWMIIRQRESDGTRIGGGDPLLPTAYTDAHAIAGYARAASSETPQETPGHPMELHFLPQDNYHPPIEPPPIGH
jgi:diacylglycerol diphosphate phosphatase/phosphatidate phosphatase